MDVPRWCGIHERSSNSRRTTSWILTLRTCFVPRLSHSSLWVPAFSRSSLPQHVPIFLLVREHVLWLFVESSISHCFCLEIRYDNLFQLLDTSVTHSFQFASGGMGHWRQYRICSGLWILRETNFPFKNMAITQSSLKSHRNLIFSEN